VRAEPVLCTDGADGPAPLAETPQSSTAARECLIVPKGQVGGRRRMRMREERLDHCGWSRPDRAVGV